jgi:predicted cupin superfamily sugar epimerase
MDRNHIPSLEQADYLINTLGLAAHPEGGYFKETYCSNIVAEKDALPERFTGDRSLLTAIYFLLKGNDFSAFHRLKSDEVWHFYLGSSLTIWIIRPGGELETVKLGNLLENDGVCQTTIPAGCWFGAKPNDNSSYSLVGCTVTPGFHFDDFELARKDELIRAYPDHEEIIKLLTRD